jgi:hypothetical protein
MTFPLAPATPSSLGLDPQPLERLTEIIAGHLTEGHGGVGSSYCWGDPESGGSFAYLTNSRIPDPWHGQRMDVISNCVHAAINAGS